MTRCEGPALVWKAFAFHAINNAFPLLTLCQTHHEIVALRLPASIQQRPNRYGTQVSVSNYEILYNREVIVRSCCYCYTAYVKLHFLNAFQSVEDFRALALPLLYQLPTKTLISPT